MGYNFLQSHNFLSGRVSVKKGQSKRLYLCRYAPKFWRGVEYLNVAPCRYGLGTPDGNYRLFVCRSGQGGRDVFSSNTRRFETLRRQTFQQRGHSRQIVRKDAIGSLRNHHVFLPSLAFYMNYYFPYGTGQVLKTPGERKPRSFSGEGGSPAPKGVGVP